jgi:hypothetical protein
LLAPSIATSTTNRRSRDGIPTEFLARVLFDQMAAAIRRGDLGASARGIETVRVVLRESHVAWAAYEGRVGDAPSS